jgi:hypothetical protein
LQGLVQAEAVGMRGGGQEAAMRSLLSGSDSTLARLLKHKRLSLLVAEQKPLLRKLREQLTLLASEPALPPLPEAAKMSLAKDSVLNALLDLQNEALAHALDLEPDEVVPL